MDFPPNTATAKDYADTFDVMACGKRVLDDLLVRYGAGRLRSDGTAEGLFVPGPDGARQTDFNLGARAVLDYILTRTDAGVHGKESHAPSSQLPAPR